MALILGIESTAHTLGFGLVDSEGNILGNVRDVYKNPSGGLIPAELSEHHVKNYPLLLSRLMKETGKTLKDIDIIAYSRGPGIGHALKIGLFIAMSLRQLLHKPVVGVNHCIAHLSIAELTTGLSDPVLLYASGANTQIIAYDDHKYRIFGETLDMGVGNFIDSFARETGIGFPGGPIIQKLASEYVEEKKNNNEKPELIDLPYVVKGMDLSFSGLFTNLVRKFNDGYDLKALAYSLQETAFAMLIEVTERAMAHLNRNTVSIGGGVGLNSRLQEMLKIMAEERGARAGIPLKSVLGDNGVMIAWQGWIEYSSRGEDKILDVYPYERTDDITVTWK